MKKILLMITIVFTLFLVGCKKDNTIVCTLNGAPTEYSWNDEDGFTEFIVNGVEMDDDYIDRLNESIDFDHIEDQMDTFKAALIEQGYQCE